MGPDAVSVVYHAVMKIVHSIWLEGTEMSSIITLGQMIGGSTVYPKPIRPSGSSEVVRIGCGRYRVYLLELTSGFT